MTKRALFALSLVLLATSAPAQADPKPWPFSWGFNYPEHQPLQYFFENPKWEHPEQFTPALARWTPQDWVNEAHGSGEYLLYKWRKAGILKGQDTDDGAPVLLVGPNFYHLSGLDKRRVLATVDFVTGRTAAAPHFFYVADGKTDEILGSWIQNQTFVTK